MTARYDVEWIPIGDLRPYADNPRRNDAAVPRMARMLREFGFRIPILARRDGEIIDGHLRHKAALAEGLDVVPVIRVDGWTEEQIRAFRIAVNQSATWADWDDDLLAQELRKLVMADFDVTLTGLDTADLDSLLAEAGGVDGGDPDDAPEPPAEPFAQPGDLWQLGGHRLLCGDARSEEDAQKLTGGARLDMIWTDPPYNVAYEGAAGRIRNDSMADAEFSVFLLEAFRSMHAALRPGGAAYVAHSDTYGLAFRHAFAMAGFKLAACLIWRKNSLVMGRGDYHWQHEPILYGWRSDAAHVWHGDRAQSTVFDVPRPAKSDLHPTMKPVALVERMIANSSPRDGLVGDFFAGSGTTLMAADRLGRMARVMELDPKFCDVIIRRWQDATGGVAVRLGDGATLPEVTP